MLYKHWSQLAIYLYSILTLFYYKLTNKHTLSLLVYNIYLFKKSVIKQWKPVTIYSPYILKLL